MVRTRMAPSPTGEYHIGHIRTLLFNYAYARKMEGKFILRIEDTDQQRYVKDAVSKILNVIKSYGLDWDEGPDIGGPYGPYTQSERLEIYKNHAMSLVDKGYAYYCFCSEERLKEVRKECVASHKIPKYDRYCRNISLAEAKKRAEKESFVIRLKVPDNKVLEYEDLVMGKISINSDNLDDQIIIKSDGFPTYHLAVVVDDHLMKISHILRGSEWISSTPKHLLLYQYFGWKVPKIGHLPVFLDPSGGGKMSKRKGSVSAQSFLEEGFLPEALLNFLALLGWSPKNDKEIFTLKEFISMFDISDINKANPRFDINKLKYINGYYMRNMNENDLKNRLLQFDKSFEGINPGKLKEIIALEKDRMKTLKDFKEQTKFFFSSIKINKKEFGILLMPKGKKPATIAKHLRYVSALLEKVQSWDLKSLKECENEIRRKAVEEKWKVIDAFSPVRVAITGSLISPPLFESMEILGREETIKRLNNAVSALE